MPMRMTCLHCLWGTVAKLGGSGGGGGGGGGGGQLATLCRLPGAASRPPLPSTFLPACHCTCQPHPQCLPCRHRIAHGTLTVVVGSSGWGRVVVVVMAGRCPPPPRCRQPPPLPYLACLPHPPSVLAIPSCLLHMPSWQEWRGWHELGEAGWAAGSALPLPPVVAPLPGATGWPPSPARPATYTCQPQFQPTIATEHLMSTLAGAGGGGL